MKPFIITGLLVAVAVAVSGCTTKAKAKKQAQAAFQAGQQQALAVAGDANRINIRFMGPVNRPEIPWEDGLTLAQAIALAGYKLPGDPSVIVVFRARERFIVPPQDLLRGTDWPLEPGDTIEIRP